MSYPIYSGDPVKYAESYDEYLEEEAEKNNPVCDICGERIDEDHYFEWDGDIICPDCMDKHRVWRD